ncbi:MAG: hypothetical protein EON90_06580 [Brevundimonas sp.]|nr:MAG: hypothetical protein EON90_06580 [Brevundimonas sp.]
MRISTVLKSALAAVALASSFAMPASAHGPINYWIYYYDNGVYQGEMWVYCDGHRRQIGFTGQEEVYADGEDC